MCGRFVAASPPDEIAAYFGAPKAQEQLEESYNVAPASKVYALRQSGPVRELAVLRWGLVPYWAKDERVGSRMINARSETVQTKPAFRRAFASRRCLIPVDGYYEWSIVNLGGPDKSPENNEFDNALFDVSGFDVSGFDVSGFDAKGFETRSKGSGGHDAGRKKTPTKSRTRKQPYFVSRSDGELCVFAGLWESWYPSQRGGPGSEPTRPVETCTILTCPANEKVSKVHHRMPVFVPPTRWDEWLDPRSNKQEMASLLNPAPESLLTLRMVSDQVNNAANQGPQLMEDVA